MPLGAGTVFRLQEGGQLRQNAPIRLTGSARTLRITADKRTAGFETTPAVELELQPAALLFVASGRPPYRLAVGSDSASPAWLPAETLLPDSGAGTLPPLASIADQPQASLVAPAEDKGIPPRTRILWAILIAGTLILGGMVVWLRKA